MLKFLRKYSAWIMVIAGSLLMVSWLLSDMLSRLGEARPGRTVMRIDGEKISARELQVPVSQYLAIKAVLGDMLEQQYRIENDLHWYVLQREAVAGGFVGGESDGRALVTELASSIMGMIQQMQPMAPEDYDKRLQQMTDNFNTGLVRAGAQARLSEREVYEGMAKLAGIMRMRAIARTLPRFSDRRLAAGYKELEDSVGIEYVFVPSDREVPNVARPSDEAIAAFFEKHKSTKPGEGENGVGYFRPERIKLEWMTINANEIRSAIQLDDIEVRKRFLRENPGGKPPEGQTEAQAVQAVADKMRDEEVQRLLRVIDQAIRAEVDRALRNSRQDGRYWVLPADWSENRPTLEHLRDVVARRVAEATGGKVQITPPTVERRNSAWLTSEELAELPGIGRTMAPQNNQRIFFTEYAMTVREAGGDHPLALQVGLPSIPLHDFSNNVYYFVVTDARKPSAPESIDEVREQLVLDMMQIEGLKRLEPTVQALKDKAVAGGFEALNLTQADMLPGQTVMPAANLPVNTATVTTERTSTMADNRDAVDQEEFRKAVVAAAAKLDPTKTLDDVPAADRFVAVALPKSRGIAVARITALNPVAVERFRVEHDRVVGRVLQSELPFEAESDPYSWENMQERLNVKLADTQVDEEAEDKPADESQS